MTFEEFFKKKRIDLAVLERVEPGLFVEFRTHYEAMGEKSFDHTKKYWFNKLRHRYQLAAEIKTDKPHIENPLAAQTIIESLTETVDIKPAPKTGFVPGFNAANMPKPSGAVNVDNSIPEVNPADGPAENLPARAEHAEAPVAAPAPKFGFSPRFRGATSPKPATTEENAPVNPERVDSESVERKSDDEKAEPPAAKPAYKPRFNMKNIPPKEEPGV